MSEKKSMSKSGNYLITRLAVVSQIWFPFCGASIVHGNILRLLVLSVVFLLSCGVLYCILKKTVSNNEIKDSVGDKKKYISFIIIFVMNILFVLLSNTIVEVSVGSLFCLLLFSFFLTWVCTKWILRNNKKDIA
jgi:hypothetical protein